LLALVGDQILRDGVNETSLSAMSRAIGSNNRMLLYYFESKENLLAEACMDVYVRFPRLTNLMAGLHGPTPLLDRLVQAWQELSHPDNVPFLRLFFEVFGAAAHSPERYSRFMRTVGGTWPLELRHILLADGIEDAAAARGSVQILAAWRGLQFALISGAERASLDDAYPGMVRGILDQLERRPENRLEAAGSA
jgi:AcrR family transcriptional regulator